jgi:hypothetical protein
MKKPGTPGSSWGRSTLLYDWLTTYPFGDRLGWQSWYFGAVDALENEAF